MKYYLQKERKENLPWDWASRSRKELHQILKTESQTQVCLELFVLFRKKSYQPLPGALVPKLECVWESPSRLIKTLAAGPGE